MLSTMPDSYRPSDVLLLSARLNRILLELLQPSSPKSYTQLWLQSLSSAPERDNLEPLKSQDQIDGGRFEVIKRLGIGGQGTTYLCYDLTNLGKADTPVVAPTVALKETIIPLFVEGVVRQQAIEKFLSEATMLRQIDSDQVVKLLDYFVDDHRAYLVLEHIEGETLRELINRRGALLAEECIGLVRQMCDILELLHKQGIIHRDFTPDNLILSTNGTLKLIDFNVAQQTSDGSTDTIVGKHAYVAPEQFRGKTCKQSDIYSMGATAFFLPPDMIQSLFLNQSCHHWQPKRMLGCRVCQIMHGSFNRRAGCLHWDRPRTIESVKL